jgi:hypothetical protein
MTKKIIIIILIFIILMLLYVLKKNKELFINENIIKTFNKNDTLIIVGKGPNLDLFMNKYELYKDFDKLGLNNSILNKKIKFKYYFQQDFTDKYPSNFIHFKKQYSKHVINNINNNLTINHKDNIKYTLNNNITPIIPKIKFDNNTTPHFNILPNYIVKNKDKINFIDTLFSNKNIMSIKDNKITIPKNHPQNCLTVALLFAVQKNYKNILLTGITMYNCNGVKKSWENYLKLFKKTFPNITLYCLYPNEHTKNVFNYDILV